MHAARSSTQPYPLQDVFISKKIKATSSWSDRKPQAERGSEPGLPCHANALLVLLCKEAVKNQPETAEQVEPDGCRKAASQLPCWCTASQAEPVQTAPVLPGRRLPAARKTDREDALPWSQAAPLPEEQRVALSPGVLEALRGLCVPRHSGGGCSSPWGFKTQPLCCGRSCRAWALPPRALAWSESHHLAVLRSVHLPGAP